MTDKPLALSERDLAILELIAKFGCCQDRHIKILCGLTENTYLRVVKRLLGANLVERLKILAYDDANLLLTRSGAKLLGLTSPSRPVLNTLNHDMLLIDLYFKLLEKNKEAVLKSDKELRRGNAAFYANDLGCIPDLLMNDKIAIELEISEKSLTRFTGIINSFIVNSSIEEVHYYLVSKRLLGKISELAKGYSKFKFFLLELDNEAAANRIVSICLINVFSSQSATIVNQSTKKFGRYTYLP